MSEGMGGDRVAADQYRLRQIAELSKSAMSAWYGLIVLASFCAVVLMGHKDADFFVFGAETTLPLIGLAAPTEIVFVGAPIALLALYAYLQAAILKLCRALAAAPEQIAAGGGARVDLDEAAHPFLFSDAALRWRSKRFRRPLGRASALAAWAFGWALAPALIAVFWVRSMPAHDESLTLFIGSALWMALAVGWLSRGQARRVMRDSRVSAARRVLGPPLGLCSVALIGAVSWSTTEAGLIEGPGLQGVYEIDYQRCDPQTFRDGFRCFWFDLKKNGDAALLYPAQLAGAKIASSPPSLAPRALATQRLRREFIQDQQERYGESWRELLDQESAGWEGALRVAVRTARAAELSQINTRNLDGVDLRRANLHNASLGGASLAGARFDDANLRGAWLEGAELRGASLKRAELAQARMEDASLRSADLIGANLGGASLEGAYLSSATLDAASFQAADLSFADLSFAQMKGTQFHRATLENAEFGGNIIYRSSFTGAKLTSARRFNPYYLENNFGDAATALPAAMTRPEHWSDEALRHPRHLDEWDKWRRSFSPKRPR